MFSFLVVVVFISIHALREESDQVARVSGAAGIISIHALREESDETERAWMLALEISIHALREESDVRG